MPASKPLHYQLLSSIGKGSNTYPVQVLLLFKRKSKFFENFSSVCGRHCSRGSALSGLNSSFGIFKQTTPFSVRPPLGLTIWSFSSGLPRAAVSKGKAEKESEKDGQGMEKTPLQKIVNKDEKGGWETAWVRGMTMWDLGGVHPAVADLVASGTLPAGRVLVPGCGSGWDAEALAGPTRHVVGLDLAETAVATARKLVRGRPAEPYVEFVAGDFFDYAPAEPFDLAFDYTFFCALNPALRPQWAQKYAQLLGPEGELLTLMFPLGDHEGGPPYAVSFQAYHDVLAPLGFEASSVVPLTNSVGPRKGREQLARWKRSGSAKI